MNKLGGKIRDSRFLTLELFKFGLPILNIYLLIVKELDYWNNEFTDLSSFSDFSTIVAIVVVVVFAGILALFIYFAKKGSKYT